MKRLGLNLLILFGLCGLASFLALRWAAEKLDTTPDAEVCATAIPVSQTDSVDRYQNYAITQSGIPITIGNANNINEVQRYGRGYIRLAFTAPNNDTLIFTSVGMWRQTDGDPELLWTYPTGVEKFFTSPDGRFIAPLSSSYTEQIPVWDTLSGEPIVTFSRDDNYLQAAAFSPDAAYFAAIAYREVTLWDVKTGSRLQTFEDFTGSTYALAFNDDGSLLAVAGSDVLPDSRIGIRGLIRVWETATGKLLATLSSSEMGEVRQLGFSPDSLFVAADEGVQEITVWELSTGKPVFNQPMQIIPDTTALDPAQFASEFDLERPKPTRVSISTDGKTLNVYRSGYQNQSRSVVHPNGREFLYLSYGASSPSYISVCDSAARTRKTLITTDESMNVVVFSPDGKQFAVNEGRGKVTLYDASTYALIATFDVRNGRGFVNTDYLVFSPDGSMLAFAVYDYQRGNYNIRIWDINARQELTILRGHTDRIMSLAFSSSGDLLASSSLDGTIRLWAVPDSE